MEENSDIFLADGDGLMYLAVPMHKNIPQHLSAAIHLVRTYLRTDFSTHLSLVSICTHVSAVGLFQKILLNTIAYKLSWVVNKDQIHTN